MTSSNARKTGMRRLPAVDTLLKDPRIVDGAQGVPREWAVDAVREALDEARAALRSLESASVGKAASTSPEKDAPSITEALVSRTLELLAACRAPSIRSVVNATGVVLHTNLGRAPLSRRALERMCAIAQGYSNVEYDLASGGRGSRFVHVESSLRRLTGAEGALVVNNCAAAVFLTLSALASGQAAVVSRGELVEIGGSFRMPDVMVQAGVHLREVGTTNRTRLADYEQALGPGAAMLLKVSQSNFAVVGFTAQVSLPELSALGRKHGVPVVYDQGSGLLADLTAVGLAPHPTVGQAVAEGADLVMFSGDKLLGGPQAGIVVGRAHLLERLRAHPLARALRVDKGTIAALEATLSHYVDGTWSTDVPIMRMLSTSPTTLRHRADMWAARLSGLLPAEYSATAVPRTGRVGGGTLPLLELESWGVRVTGPSGCGSRLDRALRAASPAIVGLVRMDALELDLRTLREGEEELISASLIQAASTRENTPY